MSSNPDAGAAEVPLPDPFQVVSIRPTPAPGGTAGTSWYRYEIVQGENRIVGYRAGGLEAVTLALESIVLGLNERRRQRRGRVHVVLQPRSDFTKAAPAE